MSAATVSQYCQSGCHHQTLLRKYAPLSERGVFPKMSMPILKTPENEGTSPAGSVPSGWKKRKFRVPNHQARSRADTTRRKRAADAACVVTMTPRPGGSTTGGSTVKPPLAGVRTGGRPPESPGRRRATRGVSRSNANGTAFRGRRRPGGGGKPEHVGEVSLPKRERLSRLSKLAEEAGQHRRL